MTLAISTFTVTTVFMCLSSSSCKMILYASASFLGPLHMLIKEDDLDSSTLVQRSYLQYIILPVLYCVSPLRVIGIRREGSRLRGNDRWLVFLFPVSLTSLARKLVIKDHLLQCMAFICPVQELGPDTNSPHSEYTMRSQNHTGAPSSCGLPCFSI